MFLLYFGGEILVLLRNLARIVPGTSIVYRSDRIGNDLIRASQGVANHSFTAPFVSYAGDLGTTLGGLVTAGCTFG